MKNYKQILILVVLSTTLLCCSKMDEYKKYINDKKFPSKVDSVAVLSGDQRALVRLRLNNDPSIKEVLMYWNNGNDSVRIAVRADQLGGYMDQLITPLNEGSYQFTLYTINSHGNRSIPTLSQGTVFGDTYRATLMNRALQKIGLSDDGNSVVTHWDRSVEDEVGIEILYESQDGSTKKVIVPAAETTFSFPDYKEKGLLKYRSLYVPAEFAVDTFSVSYSQTTLPQFERLLSKVNFAALQLPTDTRDAHGWLMKYMWDNNLGEPGFHTPPGVGLPIWYTFDIGQVARLSKLKIWQRIDNNFLYNRGNPKKFELWGWGQTGAPTTGSWTGWERLGSFESVKPSRLPVGSVNDEDRRKAAAGEEYSLATPIKSYRYLRVKILETYSGEDFTHLLELSLWTLDR